MRKSILALTLALAAGASSLSTSADARGLRIGLGFGVPFAHSSGGLSPLADSSILERANRAQHQAEARRRAVLSGERQYDAAAAARARANAAAAAAASERKRDAAAASAAERRREAAAEEAQRRSRVVERVVVEKPRKGSQTAKAPAVMPAAVPAAVTPVAAMPDENRALETAQQQQRDKAERLLKSLSPATAPVETTTLPAKSAVLPATEQAPLVTQVVAPVAAPVTAPARVEPAKPVTGECKRFIPGAGVTISVPCSE